MGTDTDRLSALIPQTAWARSQQYFSRIPQRETAPGPLSHTISDRRRITFDAAYRLIVSPKSARSGQPHDMTQVLTGYADKRLQIPAHFAPDSEAPAYHRERVFQNG